MRFGDAPSEPIPCQRDFRLNAGVGYTPMEQLGGTHLLPEGRPLAGSVSK
jgi:hypothetical protein